MTDRESITAALKAKFGSQRHDAKQLFSVGMKEFTDMIDEMAKDKTPEEMQRWVVLRRSNPAQEDASNIMSQRLKQPDAWATAVAKNVVGQRADEIRRDAAQVAKKTPSEVVHPPHYGGDTTYEAIKVIEAWNLGFSLGNTIKYISRAGKKSPDVLKDLEKARWYLDREIERLKNER